MEILEILDRCANLEYPEGNSAGHRRALDELNDYITSVYNQRHTPLVH